MTNAIDFFRNIPTRTIQKVRKSSDPLLSTLLLLFVLFLFAYSDINPCRVNWYCSVHSTKIQTNKKQDKISNGSMFHIVFLLESKNQVPTGIVYIHCYSVHKHNMNWVTAPSYDRRGTILRTQQGVEKQLIDLINPFAVNHIWFSYLVDFGDFVSGALHR